MEKKRRKTKLEKRVVNAAMRWWGAEGKPEATALNKAELAHPYGKLLVACAALVRSRH